MTNSEELGRTLLRYGIPMESECGERFFAYLALVEKWNRRINLVGSTDWEILGPLFEEGIWAGQLGPKSAFRYLDIGSGAGFPAVPVHLLNPQIQLRMIESRAKKSVFLQTACDALGLRDAQVFNSTLQTYLEQDSMGDRWQCDIISWKALKLSRRDCTQLVSNAREGTTFWIFHGEELPVEGGKLPAALVLVFQKAVPGKPGWRFSEYQKG